MPQHSRTTVAALILVALLPLTTGCSGDSEAGPPPLPTVSPAPTIGAFASDTPEPEPEPEPETAKEFIHRWPIVETDMINTGKTDEYRAISGADCIACARLTKRVKQMYADGGFAKTKTWTVTTLIRAKISTKEVPVFVVRTIASPTKYRESENGALQTLPGGVVNHQVTLAKGSDGWLLREILDLGTSS